MASNKPRRRPDYRLEPMDQELLLFHPERGTVLYCNETAALIWQLCDGQRTVEEIVALLVEAYPEAADSITGDVEATVREFTAHGALE